MGNPSGPVATDSTQTRVAEGQKVPIPVQESRAQRLQRQQARFRDRGGIFVPSTRNTLGDILCGRAAVPSPRKPRKRSESSSPRRGQVKPFPEGEGLGSSAAIAGRRTSPRKLSRKSVYNEQPEEPTAETLRSGNGQVQSVKKPQISRKGKAKAAPKATSKPRGRPPKSKAPPEASVEDENVPRKVVELANSELKSKAKSKPGKRAVTKTAAKATGSRVKKSTNSTRATEDETDEHLINESGRETDAKGQAKAARKAKASSAGTDRTMETSPLLRHKEMTRLARHCPDMDITNLSGGKHLRSTKESDVLSQDPKKDRKKAAKKAKGYKPHLAPVDENDISLIQEAEEPEQMKPTSRKRRPPDTRDSDKDDSIFDTSAQPKVSRKRPKAAHQNGSDSEGERTTFTKVKAPERVSKKRSRVASHEDTLVEPSIEKPRKRMKATRETNPSNERIEQGEPERKAPNLASRKQKENAPAAKQLKATKSSIAKPTSKPRGPPASVLKRVKQPLPMIEDDDPDPINFLL